MNSEDFFVNSEHFIVNTGLSAHFMLLVVHGIQAVGKPTLLNCCHTFIEAVAHSSNYSRPNQLVPNLPEQRGIGWRSCMGRE